MRIAAYLMVALAVVHTSQATLFRRHKNKNKGPFGGYLADFGSAALDGILRYAPDFSDVVPKVAHKLLSGGKKHRYNYNDYYDEEDYSPGFALGKKAIKRLNHLFNRQPQAHGHGAPVFPAHYGYGSAGFGHLPLSPLSSFDELPVHGVFHDPIDFGSFDSNKFGSDFSHFGHFDGLYDHGDHLNHFGYL